MKFKIHDAPQGTQEWLAARAGRATGSRAADILAKIKSGEAAARRDYRLQLVAERLTGRPQESGFTNADMQWGTEQEPSARAAYECLTGVMVRETGFLAADEMMVGCSLDGDIDEFTGIIEIKCPKTATHIGYLSAGVVPARYMPQITHNMWVTGAEWCDFISYDPRLPEHLQLFVRRITVTEVDITAHADAVGQFLSEVDQEMARLATMRAA